MTISERINGGEAAIIGKLARLDGVAYERRGNGDWRKSKDQAKTLGKIAKGERIAREQARKLEGEARAMARAQEALKAREVSALSVSRPLAERQHPDYRVAGNPGRVADFVAWAARHRKVS